MKYFFLFLPSKSLPLYAYLKGLTIFLLMALFSCNTVEFETEVQNDLEELDGKGYRHTPSTQSFLRGHHWFKEINKVKFTIGQNDLASVDFSFKQSTPDNNYFKVRNIPIDYLVPRLHYQSKKAADDFDYFNLMMAEYSRNGLSVPFGRVGDKIAHFSTDLVADIPWSLKGDYEFKANPFFKPLRFSIVNNCLSPGLWEMNATDKTGEIYHSWFQFPEEHYYGLVAKVNQLNKEEVRDALQWKEDKVALDLNRLRKNKKEISVSNLEVVDEPISYSTQGSRQKLAKKFVTYRDGETISSPSRLSDVLNNEVEMSEFVKPGLYAQQKRKVFNFSFLKQPKKVHISKVDPLTSFDFTKAYVRDNHDYIELQIEVGDNQKLIVGNLPLHLLVQQEDFAIHGFGVGILSPSGFAERRNYLIRTGFHPSFMYLAKETPNGLEALNSHNMGLEQAFIRSYPNAATPYWDITFTSYERITDIVKYRIPIPKDLLSQQLAQTNNYITPIYFSYRDDNIR